MKYLKINLFLAALLIATTGLLAQTWSDKQKEVWSFVETYSKAFEDGDYEKFMSAVHTDYKGWPNQAIVPTNKTTMGKYVKLGMDMMDVPFSNLTPLSIQVYDDFAVVHYLFHNYMKNKHTEEVEEIAGRWTDILMKDGGKWHLIADHGGQLKDDD